MKKIFYVELEDGKKIYNPSDNEIKLLSEGIKSMMLHELLTAEEAKLYLHSIDLDNAVMAELTQSVGIIDMPTRGSCGVLHSSFKEWQVCNECSTLDLASQARSLT